MTNKEKVVQAAAIYCRISLDKQGEGLGVQRQQELCEKLAAEKGWSVAEVYVDNDTSAYSGKRRPGYNRMLDDLETGRRDAVLCVDLDRLTRRPVELERFMELADAKGIALANVSGEVDLGSSDGRLRTRLLGIIARAESEKKAERVSREAEQAARRGIPRAARRPFGYEDDKVTIRPEEADLIREAARRVLAGETVPAVARDWNARGIPSPQRARHGWSASSIAGVLRNPRIAGVRAYKGEIVAEGQWEAIVDRSTWETLQGKIRRVARVGRPSTHLLSGIARCGKCGGPLWTSWQYHTRRGRRERRPRYACIKRPGHSGCGNLTVTAPPLDQYVRDALIWTLAGPEFAKAHSPGAVVGEEEARASRELEQAEARLETLAADYADGTIGRREWLAARERLTERINHARGVLDRRRGLPADLPRDEEGLREWWESDTIDARRVVIQALLERIEVTPAPRRGGAFNSDRVTLIWAV